MPQRSDVTYCRSPKCKAHIRWIRSAKPGHAPMCFDADPITIAEAAAEPRGVYFRNGEGYAVSWSPSVSDDGPLYRSHWGTCADTDRFRR